MKVTLETGKGRKTVEIDEFNKIIIEKDDSLIKQVFKIIQGIYFSDLTTAKKKIFSIGEKNGYLSLDENDEVECEF